ncbi:MAG: peptide-methionine (S)-S-oxide reductase [Verrucomicrobiota bacterium]
MSFFFRSEDQKKIAENSFRQEAERQGVHVEALKTHLEPVTPFTYAEQYHQSYYLTRYHDLRSFLEETYPDEKSFADSAVATRLNAYLGSGMDRDWESFRRNLALFGLPSALFESLEKLPH